MRATIMHNDGSVTSETVPDPVIDRPTDAIVRITASCICGSDLHPYHRGLGKLEQKRAGHEFIGIVEEVGADVVTLTKGDYVIAPFKISDGTCVNCRNGVYTSCTHGAWWGGDDDNGQPVDGGQGEAARVPYADGTLVKVDREVDDTLVPHLLALSDVMGTGHHAAVSARVGQGSTVAVIGDGAVGLSGVLAARRLGAARIVMMSKYPDRQAMATSFGATDIVATRGEEGIASVRDLFDGVGADSVLECVGSQASMDQAVGVARAGGVVGYVGAPSGQFPTRKLFDGNLTYSGGVAPVRKYIPELLDEILAGKLAPGSVFTDRLPLASVAEGYAAMDERRAIKVLLEP
ncbi:IMP dehydrogenase [Frondihabitans sp. PAMC 28766]|uniref:zinc-dependent alcohol dehydrogenase family protein n=1 Tax=Frondihabitans sp. PAMC 28766 TaxID=1795630 RepID=UPI00078E12FA|nr:zinc-dependent alcohol dehydrogenase family protein [Frondihabitans sp. PAMC 28766]AMM20357.1 IMP dehydrogenase [Frondihabitans sp. PAMC 28766]